ncbi:MAG: SDR family oxidoreductase [Planctomycetota bacterium]
MSNPFQHLDLSGKNVLITGGSRGIGAASAELLTQRGAKVAVTYGKSADEAKKLAEKIGGFAIQADAADADAAASSVEQAVAKLGGKLDILINNAGVFMMGPVGEFGREDFDRQLDVNVRGVWFTTSAAIPHLNDNGRIINIGSVVGERIPFPGASAYGMTKHAVAGFTKGWARDLAGRGITTNVVEPGPIDTEMNPADGPMAGDMKAGVPLNRYGTAHEVAELVAFLASPAAAYISGAQITIDGGMIA